MTTSPKRQIDQPLPAAAPSFPTQPAIAAVFDLTDSDELYICDRIRHMHTGRWPLFRAYAMRRVGSIVYEVAEWNPRHRRRETTISVLTWDLRQRCLRWHDCPTLAAARTTFAEMVEVARFTNKTAPAGGSGTGAR